VACVAAEHRRQQTISAEADANRQAVAQLGAEREARLSEFRMINFMIYGRVALFSRRRRSREALTRFGMTLYFVV
jgi:hypothetical protein